MQVSATFLHNAVGYDGYTPIPRYVPPPAGLKTTHNRGFWLSYGSIPKLPDGSLDWRVPDGWVDGNIKQGLVPVACVSGLGEDGTEQPAGQEAREAHYRTLAERYGRPRRVRIWEIGNEFDTPPYWSAGRPELQGQNWLAAHRIFKAVDPDCTVILGSIQSIGPEGNGLMHLAHALDAFSGGPYGMAPDAVGVHVYPVAYPIAGVAERLQQVRGVMIAHAAARSALWVTEFGLIVPPAGYEPPAMAYRAGAPPAVPRVKFADLGDKAQGQWLRDMLRALKAGGADLALYWQFDDNSRDFGGFGFDDAKKGKAVWNAAIAAVKP